MKEQKQLITPSEAEIRRIIASFEAHAETLDQSLPVIQHWFWPMWRTLKEIARDKCRFDHSTCEILGCAPCAARRTIVEVVNDEGGSGEEV